MKRTIFSTMDGSIEEWVEQELREGTDKEYLKKVLEEKGHDPGIVDQVSRGTGQDREESTGAETSSIEEGFDSERPVDTGTPTIEQGSAEQDSSSVLWKVLVYAVVLLVSIAAGFAAATFLF